VKAVILAGGLGTRISEETHLRPKPMIEIGGRPIIWHIMKLYSFHGINDFIICLGYKGYVLKEYFFNYFLHASDFTIDLKNNQLTSHKNTVEPWRVTLIETGESTMTGGRIKRVADHLQGEDDFCLTYGDGVSDVNIKELIEFHHKHGGMATLTAARPPARFGALDVMTDSKISSFKEKPKDQENFINGGFFVLSKQVIDLISNDDTVWENEPLEALATRGQLYAYPHSGFWQPMDTLRDKTYLEELWRQEKAPWKVWK